MNDIRIEVVIVIWEAGLFKSRDRIEANSFEELDTQLDVSLKAAEDRLTKTSYPFLEDDDIPF